MNELQRMIVCYGTLCTLFGLIAGFGVGMSMQFNDDKAFLEAHSEPGNNLISFGDNYYQIQKFDPYMPLNSTLINTTMEK